MSADAPVQSLRGQAEDVSLLLEQALAALWLLDALESGELCFLSRLEEADEAAPVPWYSGPPTCPLAARDLKGWLEHLARHGLANTLSQAYELAVGVGAKLRESAPKAAP